MLLVYWVKDNLLFLYYHFIPLTYRPRTKWQIRPQHTGLWSTSFVSRCSGHLAQVPPSSSFSLLLCCSPPCCPESTPPLALFWCPRHWSHTVIVMSFPHNVSHEIPSSSSDILAEVFHLSINKTSLLVLLVCQHILSTLFWKTSILFLSVVFIFPVRNHTSRLV